MKKRLLILTLLLSTAAATFGFLSFAHADPNISGLTYTHDILPLLKTNCMPCHNGSMAAAGAPNWLDYPTIYAQRAQVFIHVVQTKDMPMGKTMSDQDRQTIGDWVQAGATQ